MHCYNKNDIHIYPVVIINQILKIHVQVIFSIKYQRKCRIDTFSCTIESLLFMIFFFILNLFFFLSIFMIKYTQGKNHSLLQKLKENCQINFIVPLSYKASSKLMAHNSTTNEKRRKAIFKSVIKSQ